MPNTITFAVVFLRILILTLSTSSSSPDLWRVFAPHSASVVADWQRLEECSIDRLDEQMWRSRFLSDYHLRKPAILQNWRSKSIDRLREAFEKQRLLESFGDVNVSLGGAVDLAREGSAKAPSGTLREYVNSMPGPLYLFDSGEFMSTSGLNKDWELPPGFESLPNYENVAAGDSESYETNKAYTGTKLTLALGGAGQGIPFHYHSDNYVVQLHGRKRWAIYAPGAMTPTGFSKSESFIAWLQKRRGGKGFVAPTWECVQEPGDILYVPEGFFHATASIDDAVAVVHRVARHLKWSRGDTIYQAYLEVDRAKSTDERLRLLQRVVDMDPTNSDYWIHLGVEHAKAGSLEDLIRCMRRAISSNPLLGTSYKNLARAQVMLKRNKEALKTLKTAVKLGVGLPEVPDTMVKHSSDAEESMVDDTTSSNEERQSRKERLLAWAREVKLPVKSISRSEL